MILYIHGFGGSSKGSTVKLLRKHMDLRVEGLNYDARDPKFAVEKLVEQYRHYEKLLDYDDFDNDEILLMGSSLGGFYAAQVSAEVGCKLVMFNPALNPAGSLAKHEGEVINTADGPHIFSLQHAKRYEAYCGSAMKKTFEKLCMKNYGILLYTTEDPVINNKLAPGLCKGFSQHIHFANISEHRLGEEALINMKDEIQGFYYTLCG